MKLNPDLEPGLPLVRLVQRWQREVPLYQHLHAASSVGPGGHPFELDQLPFVTKRHLRDGFPGNFLPDGTQLPVLLERNQVELEHTSGTSGERTALLLSHGWWEQQEERALRVNRLVAGLLDAHPGARRATLTPPACSMELCFRNHPTQRERTVGANLQLTAARFPFLWSDAELERITDEIREWAPLFLDVDPVYAVCLARFCERRRIRLPSLRFVLSTYEFLSVTHRRLLSRAWEVPVFNLYGSTETGHLLMETEDGALRPCVTNAWLELVEMDSAGVGELIVTAFTNEYMPLIRYRIGDLASVDGAGVGRRFTLHGRGRDVLRDVGGRRVTTHDVDQCFAQLDGVAHYQAEQSPGGRLRVWVIPDGAGLSDRDATTLIRRLQSRFGAAGLVKLVPTEFLLGEASGKFRLTHPSGASGG